MPTWITTVDNRIFAVKMLDTKMALVTNEYGMQTQIVWAYFRHLTGVK